LARIALRRVSNKIPYKACRKYFGYRYGTDPVLIPYNEMPVQDVSKPLLTMLLGRSRTIVKDPEFDCNASAHLFTLNRFKIWHS
jgi:hypothetical protein